jgi:hypothetical protein
MTALWLYLTRTPALLAGKVLLTLFTLYPLLLAGKHIYRLGDKITVSDRSLERVSWFTKTEVFWEEVVRVKRHRTLFEEPGVVFVSNSGKAIAVTRHIGNYQLLMSLIKDRLPGELGNTLERML